MEEWIWLDGRMAGWTDDSSPNTLKFFLQRFCCLSDVLHILFLFASPRTLGEFVALNLNFPSPLPQWTWNWFPLQTDYSTNSQGLTTYFGETWVPQNMIKAMDPLSQKLHAHTLILSTALGRFTDSGPFTTTTKNHLESVLKGEKKIPSSPLSPLDSISGGKDPLSLYL